MLKYKNCTLRSVCTKLHTFPSVVCLLILNCTYCRVWFVCRYRNLHIAVCGLSVGTELYILLCVFCLSVQNRTNCCVWSVCRFSTLHIALCVVTFGSEMYALLGVVNLIVLKNIYILRGVFFGTELYTNFFGLSDGTERYTLLFVVSLLALN